MLVRLPNSAAVQVGGNPSRFFWRLGDGLIEDAVGAGVVARVAGFARSLEIGQAELRGALLIARLLAQAVLQLANLAVRC